MLKKNLFQSNKKEEIENGDASFNPTEETVKVKTKPETTTKPQEPKMVKKNLNIERK